MYILGTLLRIGFILYIMKFVVFNAADNGKILGGRNALEAEFPFVVRISGGVLCGGSLFTLQKVVTAAHCFLQWDNGIEQRRNLGSTTVIAGTIDLLNRRGGYRDRMIQNYTLTKDYKPKHSGAAYNDLAVALLDSPFVLSAYIKTTPIPTHDPKQFKKAWDQFVKSGQKCVHVGWGFTVMSQDRGKNVPSNLSQFLKVAEILPWTDDQCRTKVWPQDVDMTKEGDTCATPVIPSDSAMPGDSGGPMLCNGSLWGVLSSYAGEKAGKNGTMLFYLLFSHIEELGLTEAIETGVNINVSTASNLIQTSFIILLQYLFILFRLYTHS